MMNVTKTAISLGGWILSAAPRAAAEVGLPAPRWNLRQIQVGPGPRDSGYEALQLRTKGSSVVWGDEWRFAGDGRLASLIWSVPERNGSAPRNLGPVVPAALGLEQLEGEVPMPKVRAFDGQQLICGMGEPLRGPTSFLVAPDLTVIVEDGRWWGWRLERPLLHLPGRPGPAIVPLLRAWFDLVSDATLDDLNDRDPKLREGLEALRANAEGLRHPAGDLLASEVRAVMDNFYA